MEEPMTRIENERELAETQLESELAEELRKVMEEEARSISLDRMPRRGFLRQVVQVSLPAGMVLATGGIANASCIFCDAESGCQASCLLCNNGCVLGTHTECGTGKDEGCGSAKNQCGTCLTDL
jgi:hypothetical protein